jgi:hypothetical protein
MAATGVGPQARTMIFAPGPLLQQHFSFIIKNKYTESPV